MHTIASSVLTRLCVIMKTVGTFRARYLVLILGLHCYTPVYILFDDWAHSSSNDGKPSTKSIDSVCNTNTRG